MKLYANPTSPFVRVVRMALHEKELADEVELALVDAWADAPDFLDANPAGRVPALVTDEGVRLTEAMLILQYLEAVRPEPAVLPRGAGAAEALGRAGVAVGVFDAAVSVIIGRKSAPEFDDGMVGRKRFRTMRDGFGRIEAASPEPGPRGARHRRHRGDHGAGLRRVPLPRHGLAGHRAPPRGAARRECGPAVRRRDRAPQLTVPFHAVHTGAIPPRPTTRVASTSAASRIIRQASATVAAA
jgi:glutathione S-transferase